MSYRSTAEALRRGTARVRFLAPPPLAKVRLTHRAQVLLWLTVAILVVVDGTFLVGRSPVTVAVEGRLASLPAGSTVAQTLRRLGVQPTAGNLLAVDRTTLRPGVYPPTVLVNGRAAPSHRRLHAGDRVSVVHGRDQIEPVVRMIRRLPASVPGNPVRSLATGPAEAVLVRGRLSGRVVPVAFRPAGRAAARLPVALTFDDGPWPGTTEQILAILAARKAPATFFLVGRQVEREPALAMREQAAGMAIGSHSFGHPQPFDRLPAERIRDEIAAGHHTLERLGMRPVGFRPPGGAASSAVVAAADGLSHRTILWTVDPSDWQPGATSQQLIRRVLTAVRPGAIVLLHDGGGDRSATVAALPGIIDGLRRLGLTPTVLPD